MTASDVEKVSASGPLVGGCARGILVTGAVVAIPVLPVIAMFLVKLATAGHGFEPGSRMGLSLGAAIVTGAAVMLVALRVLRGLRRSRRGAVRPAAGLVGAPVAAPDCPYCKSEIEVRAAEGTVRCPSCGTAHHAGCWAENQGCTIHGCARSPRSRGSARSPERA